MTTTTLTTRTLTAADLTAHAVGQVLKGDFGTLMWVIARRGSRRSEACSLMTRREFDRSSPRCAICQGQEVTSPRPSSDGAGAGSELGVRRDLRPAAAHLDGRIAEQRLLDSLIGALVEHRIGRECECRRRP